MTRATWPLAAVTAPLLASLVGCSALLGGQDLPSPEDGGLQDSTTGDGPGSGSKADSGADGARDSGSSSGNDSGSSGSDSGSGDAAGDATGACTPGETQCSGNGVETCTASGTWGVAVGCVDQTCMSGQCGGSCAPGQTQCTADLTGIQTCTSSGTWGTAVGCPGNTCVASGSSGDAGTGGATCEGVCAPGQVRCAGADGGAGGNIPQSCSGGQWQSGTACTDVCSAGQCGGNCSPGQTECGTSNNVLTCPASGTWPTSGGTSCTSQGKACVQTGATAACSGTCVPGIAASCGSCGKGTETCTSSGNPGTCVGDPPATATCGPCNDGTSSCGGPCQGGTTNVGSCGSCGGTNECGGGCSVATPGNLNQSCGTCGGTIECSGSCSMGPTSGSGGPTETVNLDFNTSHCTAGSANFAWTPNYGGPSNPSGSYTVSYNFTDHNNMSGSTSTVFYIGCSGSPTSGNGYSEAELTSTVSGTLTCPVGQSVVWYPTVCGQSGGCCGDPTVNWNITGWTSSNAICQ